jgi:hypothetical protein
MAFSIKGFALGSPGGVAGTSGQYQRTHASYITTDTAATVEGANYFLSIFSNLPVGTTISSVMNVAATPVFKEYVVTASSSTTVTIALQSTSAG